MAQIIATDSAGGYNYFAVIANPGGEYYNPLNHTWGGFVTGDLIALAASGLPGRYIAALPAVSLDGAIQADVYRTVNNTLSGSDIAAPYFSRQNFTVASGVISYANAQYTGIANWTRQCLNKTLAQTPDSALTLLLSSVIDGLAARFPCLPNYVEGNFLSDFEQRAYEEAAGTVAAARLLLNPGLAPAAQLRRVTEGDADYQYYQNFLPQQFVAERDMWLKDAANALLRISCIKQAKQAQLNALPVFQVSGPTRTKARGGELSIFAQLLSVTQEQANLRDYSHD